MEANSYQTSSYAWRSIIQTQHLLKQGIKWVVRNGKIIKIWEDNWIHNRPATSATGVGSTMHQYTKLNQLFLPHTKVWNVQLIRNIMSSEDAAYILNLRSTLFDHQDIPIWCLSKTGEYTVET
ncbi:hypothetical protein N665_0366s0024 [Sinapis alba]|nr:hypothetical protein N665_0366s0024 [Sinapis alba]